MTYKLTPITISGYKRGQVYFKELKSSSVSTTINNIGEVLQAVDGSTTYMHRSYKRTWSLSWNMIIFSSAAPNYPLDTVASLRDFFTSMDSVSSSYVFTFEDVQYKVIPEPNSFEVELSANNVMLTNVPYYNVSFRLVEE
jgi:hypothetical protein